MVRNRKPVVPASNDNLPDGPIVSPSATLGNPPSVGNLAGENPRFVAATEAVRPDRKERKKRESRKVEPPTDLAPLLRPVFDFGNVILVKYGIEPLSESEVQTGVAAWTPLCRHYLPKLEDNLMYVLPLLWTAGVVTSRLNTQLPLPLAEPPKPPDAKTQ